MSDHRAVLSPSLSSEEIISRKKVDTAYQSHSRLPGSLDESRSRQVTFPGLSLHGHSSTSRHPSASVYRSLVAPIKTHIRKETTTAVDLLDEIRHTLGDLEDKLPQADEDSRRNILKHVQTFLLRAERTAHRVQDLPNYIFYRLQHPAIARSRDNSLYAEEILTVLREQNSDKLLQQLSDDTARLTTILMDYRYEISHFDPIVAGPPTGLATEPFDTEDIPSPSAPRTASQQPLVALTASRHLPVPQVTEESLKAQNEQLQATIRRLEESNAQALKATEKRRKELEEEAYYRNLELQLQKRARSMETVATGEGSKAYTAIPTRTIATTAITPTYSDQPANPEYFKNIHIRSEDPIPSTADTRLMSTLMRNPSVQQKTPIDEVHQMTVQAPDATATSMVDMEVRMNNKLFEHFDALLTHITHLGTANGAAEEIKARVRKHESLGKDITAESDVGQEPPRPPRAPTPSRNMEHALTHRHLSSSSDNRVDRTMCDNKQLSLDTEVQHITVFDGSGNYELFRASYIASVLRRPSVDPIQKYVILKDKLSGEAAICLASLLKDPTESVIKTLVNLDEIYGNQNDKYTLLEKLTQLRFHPTDTKKMRLDIISHQSVIDLLINNGVAPNDDRVTMALAAKLPASVRATISDHIAEIGESVTFSDIFGRVKELIKAMEMDQLIVHNYPTNHTPQNDSPITHASVNIATAIQPGRQDQGAETSVSKRPLAYDPAKYRDSYYDVITKTSLDGIYAPGPGGLDVNLIHRTFPYSEPEEATCKTCDGAHYEMRCPLTSTEFRQASKERGLCPLCNNRHPLEKCRRVLRCGYCDGLHHMGGCPKKEFYRDMVNYPKEAKPVSNRSYPIRAQLNQ